MSGTATQSLAIPASQLVSANPSVLAAGGNALDMIGLALTDDERFPINAVLGFATADDVGSYAGDDSDLHAFAEDYFLGFDNSNKKPGKLLVARYNQTNVGAFLRGATLGLSLSQLQALTGTIVANIDGSQQSSASINLSSATSFSAAAELITVALGTIGPSQASFIGSITGTTLTVSGMTSGALDRGQEIRGAGISTGTQIADFGTGTGGSGTYTLTQSMNVSSQNMTSNTPTVTWDSISGSFVIQSATVGINSAVAYASGSLAGTLGLTQAAGAVQSPGASAASPDSFMTGITRVTQNWVTFSTTFDPDGGSGNTVKQAFSAWANARGNRYGYVGWDQDPAPSLSASASSSFGARLKLNDSSGTLPLWGPVDKAAFVMGFAASVDFTQFNGRNTLAYRSQTGLTPDVTNATIADNLMANGYNFYGNYATANQEFQFLQPGSVSGPFLWFDSFLNQIWLTNEFQLALMVLLKQVGSIPYNQAGYSLIRSALLDPVLAGVNFGAIRPGVTLSQSQIAQVNNSAGIKIDTILGTQGWYIQVRDAAPQTRMARGSPPTTVWYMDGQSVQKINVGAVEVQ